jgi:hypothetical protein
VLGEDWGGTASTQGDTPTGSSASEVKKTGQLAFYESSAFNTKHKNKGK